MFGEGDLLSVKEMNYFVGWVDIFISNLLQGHPLQWTFQRRTMRQPPNLYLGRQLSGVDVER
jgi:hypothetical protein